VFGGNLVWREFHAVCCVHVSGGMWWQGKGSGADGGGVMEDRLSSVIDPLDLNAPFTAAKQVCRA
jgi:hypothetical protein